ncbi:DUF4440 domain-containing protein [Nocardioides marmoriginsengisoli]|uniref:DUF4440 domain-containing protein n=1 Tax=Nocardioides marmoriginsengisoli TaxID=661483 RepID=A0A3N0CF09_9ACTN|nr:DUF4440 domain-containing protein [Nocardioides marmoriginsengisoli]RNL62018.1 DUF4440 domain-containing protein [Nocardioides marmoriginsengisoli]
MTTPKDSPDVADIRSFIALASEAQNRPETLLPMHTADTAVVNIVGRRVLGLEALTHAMTKALSSPLANVRTSVEILDVRFPHADLAVVSCTKAVHDERTDDERSAGDDLDDFPTTSALTYVLVRTGASWKIALAQTTPVYA